MRGSFSQAQFQPPPNSGARKPYVEPRDLDGRGREEAAYLAAILGPISVMALAASFIWAHHWGPLAFTIVGFWAITTAAAFVLGMMARHGRSPARGLALLALACVSISAIAVLFMGTAAAAGYDPTGLCGGG